MAGSPEVVVRPAVAADAAAVARIHHRGWTEAYRGLVPHAHLEGLSYDACLARWQAGIQGATRMLVADVGSAVVGFVTFGPSADADARAAGEVWDLWVLPEERSRGIGAALLQAGLVELATSYRAGLVWVLEGNARGRAFYERHGGVRDGVSRTQLVAGGTMADVRYLFDLRGVPSAGQ
ncbi:MAG TPA: GNAT family N-acetyltransferase [Propionibacteriaceae bacterium]|nr:GNAT family N-acetyltransferase [Propionibacteriaceae bacterium]